MTKWFQVSRAVAIMLVCAGICTAARAVEWLPLGPYGGDARSFGMDPKDSHHIFLGTADGWIYESHNNGADWTRISRLSHRDDLVLDHILVDPLNARHLLVATWVVDRPDGGIFISDDGGASWYEQEQMKGQSIRSLAIAPSDPHVMVAGTLRGVFRSTDSGVHWSQISPTGSSEIHEIESVAFDPRNPEVIYAGTWHLPWKTLDGGKNWFSIKNGIWEDSDVFSIIVDPRNPNVIFASACSGIYKSVDAGAKFTGGFTQNQGQGIPLSARRTRKLLQDPGNGEMVYAGTTEGLYRTTSGGGAWTRLTDSDVIVNDVLVDPTNTQHVLLATDRAGVLESENAGQSFHSSNTGFSARQITAYSSEPGHPGTLYVGVVNDKAAGGVFMSLDGGLRWAQQSQGLAGRDVFSLLALPDGDVLAGTSHGIFRLAGGVWSDGGMLTAPAALASPVPVRTSAEKAHRGEREPVRHAVARAIPQESRRIDDIVYSLVSAPGGLYAGTEDGVLRSTDNGRSWTLVPSLKMPEARFVAAQKTMVLVGGLKRMSLSMDAGQSWDNIALPADLTQIASLTVDELGNLWVAGREGVFYSTDYGLNWKTLRNLYVTQADSVYFDAANHRVLATAKGTTTVFSAHLPDYKVENWDTGWNLRFVRPVGDHLVGATLFDGMVVEPRLVDSKVGAVRMTAAR